MKKPFYIYLLCAFLVVLQGRLSFAGYDNPMETAPIDSAAPQASPAAAIPIAAPVAVAPPAMVPAPALLSPRQKVLTFVAAASIVGALAYWNWHTPPVSLPKETHVPLSSQALSQIIDQCRTGSGLACGAVWGELLELGWAVEADIHVEEAMRAIALTEEGNIVTTEFDMPIALFPQRIKLLTLLVQKGRCINEARSALAKQQPYAMPTIGNFTNLDWAIFHLNHALKRVGDVKGSKAP